MLVLSRQPGQSIRIGNGITVTVLNCRGNHIRIGVSAPQDVPVHREEVYLRNQQAHAAEGNGLPAEPPHAMKHPPLPRRT
jgi:carbon storage regulator